IFFRSRASGQVGQGQIEIIFEVRREEFLTGSIEVGSTYVPGTYLDVIFDDKRTPTVNDMIDLGFQISLAPGAVDQQGSFIVGLEDFEGYHIWRGIRPDGADLTVIGELSKEEAFIGQNTGGNFVDSLYFHVIVPELRSSGVWFSPFGAVECLGTRIGLSLQSDELFWFDCNAFNGFTYYYAVTTFDRDYGVTSGRQGLVKFDNCTVVQDSVIIVDGRPRRVFVPYECSDELRALTMEVDTQADPAQIYVVPNPYRTGTSRLTTENYHNFPDDVVRFVNVPSGASMKVYTMSGDLVWEFEHPGPKGNVIWDTKNRGGVLITSGVYIFRVELENGDSMFGRFVVIR
ncbi:MAG: hypothetical protein IH969_06640, partial [Candidatus Krumholzibacteriota bacterium]|nr:hypothetical protein [Candidatus Krumholzibacteriota bacterium]